MVLYGEYGPPFHNRSTRIMFDIAFWVVALLHILRDYLYSRDIQLLDFSKFAKTCSSMDNDCTVMEY
jgi:hypothetical protein